MPSLDKNSRCFRKNKKSRIYGTSDLSISFAKSITNIQSIDMIMICERGRSVRERPMWSIYWLLVIDLCERVRSASLVQIGLSRTDHMTLWERLCAREHGLSRTDRALTQIGLSRTQPLSHRLDSLAQIGLSHRLDSLTDRTLSHRVMWSVRERPCAREHSLSDWLRQITWQSERGRVWESPISDSLTHGLSDRSVLSNQITSDSLTDLSCPIREHGLSCTRPLSPLRVRFVEILTNF